MPVVRVTDLCEARVRRSKRPFRPPKTPWHGFVWGVVFGFQKSWQVCLPYETSDLATQISAAGEGRQHGRRVRTDGVTVRDGCLPMLVNHTPLARHEVERLFFRPGGLKYIHHDSTGS